MIGSSDEFIQRTRTARQQAGISDMGTDLKTARTLTAVETLHRKDPSSAVDLMENAPAFDDSESTQQVAAYLPMILLEQQFTK